LRLESKLRLAWAVLSATIVMTACGSPGSAEVRDLWWLVAAAEADVPLTVAKVEQLLGISLHSVTPYRWEGGPTTLGPALTVTNAATTANGERQDFTYFGVDAGSCVSLDEALVRYPGLVPKYLPTGHSEAEQQVWASPRDWGGELMFSVDPETRCVQGFSLQTP